MILFNNKNEMIEAHKEIGKPLPDDIVTGLEELSKELHELKLSKEIVLINLFCRICGYKETSIVPAVVDLDNLECFNCGNMTCQEADDKEWWEE